jgi:hypothetical protein
MSLKIDAWGRGLILVAIEEIEDHLLTGGSHAQSLPTGLLHSFKAIEGNST